MKMNILFPVLMLLIYLAGNTYVFFRIGQLLPLQQLWQKVLYVALVILLAGSLFLALGVSRWLPSGVSGVFYQIGSTWFFIFIYLLLFLLLRDIVWGANRLWHFIPESISLRPAFKTLFTAVFLGLALLFLIGGHINYWCKRRVELNLTTAKQLERPLKIVAFSDMHLGYMIREGELARWVKKINAEQPDLILIAGDLIDNNLYPLENGILSKELKQLKAPLGVCAVLGNHEYISGVERSVKFLEESHIRVLRDSALLVDNRFYVVGRDDRSNRNRKQLSTLLQGVDSSKPVIVLDHQPYELQEVATLPVDLQISGHTHRGQLWPVNWITDAMYEVSHGYLKKGDTHFYVSSGLGIWGGKFRIGSQSEYVVIHLSESFL